MQWNMSITKLQKGLKNQNGLKGLFIMFPVKMSPHVKNPNQAGHLTWQILISDKPKKI